MKTIITALLLCFSLVCHGQDTNAMVKVFRQRYAARMFNSRIIIDHGRMVSIAFYEKDFLPALEKIDTSACPTPFKLAWFDYRKALEKLVSGKHVALDAMRHAKTPVSILMTGIISHQAEAEEVQEFWDKVERAALEAGLDTEKIKY